MTQTKVISYDMRIRAFWALSCLSIFFLGLYIYAVNMTIHNTALRQSLEAEVVELAVEQSALEFAYIEKSQSISMEMALERGFKEVEKPLYISRIPGRALVYNTR